MFHKFNFNNANYYNNNVSIQCIQMKISHTKQTCLALSATQYTMRSPELHTNNIYMQWCLRLSLCHMPATLLFASCSEMGGARLYRAGSTEGYHCLTSAAC